MGQFAASAGVLVIKMSVLSLQVGGIWYSWYKYYEKAEGEKGPFGGP